jgi:hypothetical protein
MTEQALSTRLDPATAQRLRSLPLNERVRYLRATERSLTQEEFLARLAELDSDAPRSKGWVSGIESGNLNLAPRWAKTIGDALRLHDEDRWLLEPVPDGATVSPGLVRYAAWQAIRLSMADELIRSTKSTEGRTRGRGVRRLVADTLQQDDDVRHASGGRVGSLDPFTELPEVTRWMLVVEAAYCDPFLPYQPLDTKWGSGRTAMLEQVADELGLPDPASGVALIESARGSSFTAWLKDHEPKAPEPDPGGVALTSLSCRVGSHRARVLRADSLVGSLGWGAACGTFLAPSFRGPRAGDLPAASTAWLPEPAKDEAGTGIDLGSLLLSLGEDTLTRSLSMLTTLVQLRETLDTPQTWSSSEAVPDRRSAEEWLTQAAEAVELLTSDGLNADGSPASRHSATIAAIITRYLGQVSG